MDFDMLTTQEQAAHLQNRLIEQVKLHKKTVAAVEQLRQNVIELIADIDNGVYDDIIADSLAAIKMTAMADLAMYTRLVGTQ
jgi:hypothetical protein